MNFARASDDGKGRATQGTKAMAAMAECNTGIRSDWPCAAKTKRIDHPTDTTTITTTTAMNPKKSRLQIGRAHV